MILFLSQCSKTSVDDQLIGKWQIVQVELANGQIQDTSSLNNFYVLSKDKNYELIFQGGKMSSGKWEAKDGNFILTETTGEVVSFKIKELKDKKMTLATEKSFAVLEKIQN
ncbi:MAG TPA: hypothetical protein DHW82_03720 [Spirochaetia bacterium]|nr:hypothetical protein [Spirochaetia bacterium]